MADHIATRKSTFTSASTSRMTRTHSPIVNGSKKRVSVYSKGVTYGVMSKQTQAEPCVLYIRVSTTRQANQGVSLKAQIARGKLHAQYQNFLLPNTHIFIDRGISAKTPLWSRPAGKQMKAFVAKHKIKQIIAYRMDRLFRNTLDCLATVEELEKQGVGIQLCESGGMPLDLSTAMGKMMLTMLAGFGEMERNIISERTTMALQHLKDTGRRFTYDKYGWDADKDNNFIENEEEQYWIEYIKVRHHEDGISISQIARELNTCGVPTKRGGKWSHKQVSRILKRELRD
jgi:site-specific DNA recombinase